MPLKAGMQSHRGRHAACPSQADVADCGGHKREQMPNTGRCAGGAFAASRSNAAECSFGALPASGVARDSFFRGQLDPEQHPRPAFGRSDTLCGVLYGKVVTPHRQPRTRRSASEAQRSILAACAPLGSGTKRPSRLARPESGRLGSGATSGPLGGRTP